MAWPSHLAAKFRMCSTALGGPCADLRRARRGGGFVTAGFARDDHVRRRLRNAIGLATPFDAWRSLSLVSGLFDAEGPT
jgi:hypothetical protein